MLTGHYTDVPAEKPGMANARATIRWLLTAKKGAPNFAMRVIEIAEPGGVIPLHTHDYEHEVFVFEGRGRLLARQGPTDMSVGDYGLVLPLEEHGFENTGTGPFRFICVIPNPQPGHADHKFAAAINCMDGRTQIPVIEWMRREYGVEYVDSITEPGPVRILAEAGDSSPAMSILGRLAISAEQHGSRVVAVVAHADCAGNPKPESEQLAQLRSAIETVKVWRLAVEPVGLWIGEDWRVRRVY